MRCGRPPLSLVVKDNALVSAKSGCQWGQSLREQGRVRKRMDGLWGAQPGGMLAKMPSGALGA